MARNRGSMLVLALAVAGACGSPTPTPTPTTNPTTSASIDVSGPTPAQTAQVTASPAATPTASIDETQPPTSPSPTPEETQGASDFLEIADFPGPNNVVSDATVGNGGTFVAVGYAEQSTPSCNHERFARAWTSADGLSWRQADLGDQRAWFTDVVAFEGSFYAFANAGGYCHGGNVADVWKSSDGSTWAEIASGVASGHALWCSADATTDRLVATVFVVEGIGFEELWESSTGTVWSRVTRGHDEPCSVMAHGADVASLVGFHGPLHGNFLEDGRWLPAIVDSDYDSRPHALSFGDALFASTRSCCGFPMTDVGLILRSADGREWTVVGEPHLSPSDALTTVGDLLVSYSAEGKTELSRDGISWLQGPAAPQIDPDSLQIAIGGETGLTVIGWDGLFQSRAWFIPRRAFDDALNGAVPVESAPMPEVGVPYPLQLSVPCSADSLHVVIGGRMFGATFDDVANSNLGRFRDDGSVVLSDATHAMYTTSTGDLVPLTAQHPATDPASCF